MRRGLPGDVADQLGDLRGLGVVGPPLLGDRVRRAEPRRERAGLLGEAGVGRDDDQIGERLRRDRLAQDRHRVEVVDRHVEEALQLRRVQVHRDHAVDARALDRVGADAARIDTRGSSFLSPFA